MRAGAAFAAAASVLLLAGCGGGGDGGGAFDQTVDAGPPPKPEESISAFAGRLASAVDAGRQGKCEELEALSRTGAMRLNCDARARRAFSKFKVTRTARYGTGGIVEFANTETKGRARGVYTVTLDPRGRWAFTGPISLVLPKPTIGTRARYPAGPRRVLGDFLDAVKRSDCAAFYDVTFTPGLNRQQACARNLGGYATMAKGLKDADPKLERLGGTADFTFYGLRTADEYRTAVVLKTPAGEQPYLMIGAFKGPS